MVTMVGGGGASAGGAGASHLAISMVPEIEGGTDSRTDHRDFFR